MTTQEFLKGALSKAASTATRLVPQIKPAVAVAKGVMNEVSKTPPVQPVQVLKTAANMAVNTNPAVAVAKSLYTPTAAGAKSAVSSLATAMKPAQAAPVAGPVYNGPVQNARPPVATQNPSPAIRPPVPANPPGQSALSTPGAGFTSTDPTIRAQVEAMSRSAAQPTAPIRPPVVSTPDIKSLSMAAVSNNDRAAQIKALNDAYTRSLQLSPEEEAKQQQLDAISQRQALLRQSYNEGDSNIRNQAIPMQFVTGQQAALQRQYTNQQEGIAAESLPLKDQLALLQQRRAANQAAAKANLDFEQAQYKMEQEQSKPVEVGGSLIQYDPATGTYKTLFSAPEKPQNPITLGEGQILIDPVTGKQIAAGNPKAVNKLGELTPAQANAAFKLADDYEKASKDISAVTGNYNRLLSVQNSDSPAGDMSLIFSFMKIQDPGSVVREGEYANAQNAGAVSDQIRNLYNKVISGTRLTPEQRKDFVSQAANLYNATLQQQNIINKQFAERSQKFGIPPEYVVRDLGSYTTNSTTDDTGSLEDQARNAGIDSTILQSMRSEYGDEQTAEYLKRKMGGLTNAAPAQAQNGVNTRVEKLAAAIKQHESGGNYNAKGASTEGGAYQFMPSTWSQWAKQYLGNANAPMTPQNQDTVAKAKISDLFNQGYNEQQIALIWNGGQPVIKKGVNKYGVPYDTGKYANSVLSIYKKLG